ncbi:MAG: zinc ribbon domain-containing protein [Chitinophagaceae bacterium]|nr:MAG: zinc ribbon domain-containing protein [Chitinophagaceae bacterium]
MAYLPSMTCPFCTTFNDHDARYCKQCGTHLPSGQRDIFAEPVRKEDISDTGYLWMALLAFISTFLYALVFPFLVKMISSSTGTMGFYRGWGVIYLIVEFSVLAYFTRNASRRTAIICIGTLLLLFNIVSFFGIFNF